ncbi:hypothetical protein PENSUB_13325 [Penicillium subrubescens]|uniref:Uncharacterized protein n=1 Tax=Penicillium subrubescens TaxID=1316194 RepID=A0A1Q5SRI9_9EURO|nr:hypothetical protein PENSUB_13325 [Penicillium subrubescens]
MRLSISRHTQQLTLNQTKGKARVQFASDTTLLSEGGLVPGNLSHSDKLPPITDICQALVKITAEGDARRALGWVSDESHRHNVYYVGQVADSLKTQSLEDLITTSSTFTAGQTNEGFLLSQRDRLRLEAGYETIGELEISCSHPNPQPSSHHDGSAYPKSDTLSSRPYSRELSLCQTLEALSTSDDADLQEAVANLKTAARVLPSVMERSGPEYARIVEQCLFWHGSQDFQFGKRSHAGKGIRFDHRAFDGELKEL